MGPVEMAIRESVKEGTVLATPSQGKPFVVESINHRGVVLLFGKKQTKTPFSWSALEGIRTQFGRGNWTVIGGRRDVEGLVRDDALQSAVLNLELLQPLGV